MKIQRVHGGRVPPFFSGAMVLLVIVLASVFSSAAAGDRSGQRGFASPQQAVDALIAAVQDDNDDHLLAILGSDSEDLIFSGDRVADQNGRVRFLEACEENYGLEQDAEGRTVLVVGHKEYPFPIPIVQRDGSWFFDTPSGREEILNRRIGRNELHTIEVMQAYVDAQREYISLKHEVGGPAFAQKFTSSPGMKDGLYWEAEDGGEESPFGPLIARAAEEGYAGSLDQDPPEPLHGYYFRIIKGKGPHANGGAFDYVVDGKMVLGFALLAYPARYGASGIMTFLINQEGIIYEKDLGEESVTAAAAITTFDPDDTWNMYYPPGVYTTEESVRK